MTDFRDARLGDTTKTFALASPEDITAAIVALVSQSRRVIRIVMPDKDGGVYNNPLTLDTLSSFCRGTRYRHIHVLLKSSTQLLQDNWQLVDLSHRLGGGIEIRVCEPEHQIDLSPCLLADSHGLLLGPNIGSPTTVNFNIPSSVNPLANRFQNAWEHSGQSEELRRLSI